MTARLYVREVSSNRFEPHNGDFLDTPSIPRHREGRKWIAATPTTTGEEKAHREGERLLREGNVEEFQIWTLQAQFRRSTVVEEVKL